MQTSVVFSAPIHNRVLKKVSFAEILYLEGNGNYTQIFFNNGKRLMFSRTLKYYEGLLASDTDYVRTHKSFLVNLHCIKSINWQAEEPFMTLSNNAHIAIARRKRAKVRKRLNGMQFPVNF